MPRRLPPVNLALQQPNGWLVAGHLTDATRAYYFKGVAQE